MPHTATIAPPRRGVGERVSGDRARIPIHGGTVMSGIRASRTYRLHIFDGQYEVLHKRIHTVDLDLDSPAAEAILLSHLGRLTREAEAAGEYMGAPRLEVRDFQTGAKVRDVSGA